MLHRLLRLSRPSREKWFELSHRHRDGQFKWMALWESQSTGYKNFIHGGQLILACVGPNLSISCAQLLVAILYLCVLLFNVVKHYLNIVYQI